MMSGESVLLIRLLTVVCPVGDTDVEDGDDEDVNVFGL